MLSSDPLTVELSYEDSGKILGIDYKGFGTYRSAVRPDGTIFSEGEGTVMTQDAEFITYTASALGTFKKDGSASHRGIIYYRTTSSKLARLNGVPGVFETEADPEGNHVAKVWEWK